MPFELGIFLTTKKFGDEKQQKKKCLILDKSPYRYQLFISDISDQDIEAHEDKPAIVVLKVRDWLRAASKRSNIPSGSVIWGHYKNFIDELPSMCSELNLNSKELIFSDYIYVVTVWLKIQNKKKEILL